MKLQQHKGLKLNKIVFLGKNHALWFLNKKWPKLSFLSFIINQCIKIFLDFLYDVTAA